MIQEGSRYQRQKENKRYSLKHSRGISKVLSFGSKALNGLEIERLRRHIRSGGTHFGVKTGVRSCLSSRKHEDNRILSPSPTSC